MFRIWKGNYCLRFPCKNWYWGKDRTSSNSKPFVNASTSVSTILYLSWGLPYGDQNTCVYSWLVLGEHVWIYFCSYGGNHLLRELFVSNGELYKNVVSSMLIKKRLCKRCAHIWNETSNVWIDKFTLYWLFTYFDND